MQNKAPFGENYMTPRAYAKKGWGDDFGGLKDVGEVNVYHKKRDWDMLANEQKWLPEDFKVDTVKLLIVKKGKSGSLHFHKEKDEAFFCTQGIFEIMFINKDSEKRKITLEEGDFTFVPAGLIHKIKGVGDRNILLEVSTLDKPDDSYKIARGD